MTLHNETSCPRFRTTTQRSNRAETVSVDFQERIMEIHYTELKRRQKITTRSARSVGPTTSALRTPRG